MQTPSTSRSRRWLTLLSTTLVLGTAACESTSAPEPAVSLDTEAAMQDYRAFRELFSTPGWQGFTALSGRTPLSSASSASAFSAVTSLPTLVDAGSSRQYLAGLFAARAARNADDPLSSVVLISNALRGRTLVYDATAGEYRVDSTRTGAPANGVRFITYRVDANDQPISGQEIGYAELTDEGVEGDATIALRLVSVEGDRTVLDYRTTVTGEGSAGRLTVDGFVADAGERLNFSISARGEESGGSGTIDLDFTLALANRSFDVVGEVRGASDDDSGDGEGQVELTVRHGSNRLDVSMRQLGGTLDGLITLNGRTFVTVMGDKDDPTLLGATGDPLTGGELLVVLAIVDVVDDVFDLVEELVEPVDNLIVLGWVL